MFTLPIFILLLVDLALLLRGLSKSAANGGARDRIALCALFFFSGMPALVYQIVWQRALFSIYGVNAQSVAVIVAAFMIGLGIGSLAGGWASSRFPSKALFLFGAGELGVAIFGLSSLRLFHWAAGFSAGASLPVTILFGFALLIVPTVLMGATLPLLVQRLVAREGSVGAPVALLYFVNTFGSAVACYLCATYLLRVFGQSGSVGWAAALNVLVGMSALALGRKEGAAQRSAHPAQLEPSAPRTSNIGLAFVMFVAASGAMTCPAPTPTSWFPRHAYRCGAFSPSSTSAAVPAARHAYLSDAGPRLTKSPVIRTSSGLSWLIRSTARLRNHASVYSSRWMSESWTNRNPINASGRSLTLSVR